MRNARGRSQSGPTAFFPGTRLIPVCTRAAGRTARALHAAALTEGQRVEAVAVALTAAVCEGKALVPLLVVPELVQVGVAGPNDLGQAADVLGLEAGRLAGLSRQEAVAVPFLSAVYKFLHS